MLTLKQIAEIIDPTPLAEHYLKAREIQTILAFASIKPADLTGTVLHLAKLGLAELILHKEELIKAASNKTIEDAKIAAQKRDMRLYKHKIDYFTLKNRAEEIEELSLEMEAISKLDLLNLDREYLEKSRQEGRDCREASRRKNRIKPLLPVTDLFNHFPFYRKNLLFFGAVTGGAKTTTALEITRSVLAQRRPDGTKCRVLYLTNEESRESFLNRLAYAEAGIFARDADEITDEQVRTIDAILDKIESENRLVILDENYPGYKRLLTSIEGITAILERLLQKADSFDCIIIDYFSKIDSSKNDSDLSENTVLARLVDTLDSYRKKLQCPIVIFGQLHPKSAEKSDFESRIKGRKRILEAATCAIEIIANKARCENTFKIEKCRPGANADDFIDVTVGFYRGGYVPLDSPEFAAQKAKNDAADKEDALLKAGDPQKFKKGKK